MNVKKEKLHYLTKTKNFKIRNDYIDNLEYINGVKNENGEVVIRPLNEQELKFLNKFNAEYYHAVFDKNPENNLHKKTANLGKLKEIQTKIQETKNEINRHFYQLQKLKKRLARLEEKYGQINPEKELTDANNARNRCVFNKSKSNDMLVEYKDFFDLETDD